jgi:hypothetical protein
MATTLPFPTINVVPAGFRWTADSATKARAKGAFVRVGGPQLSRRFLSGANRSWAKPNPEEYNTIFHTGYRITGTPEAVQTALAYAGVPASDIQQVLATSITRNNFDTTMAAAVKQELAEHTAVKQTKPTTEGYEWEQVLWFAQNVKTAVIQTKTGEQKGGVTSSGRAGTGESLGEKVRKIAQGKVLDVSGMDMNTGKGVRTIAAPRTAKSGKFGTARVPIISNNIDKYIRAIQLAYGAEGEQAYAQDIQVVNQALSNAGVATIAAPLPSVLTKVPSPVRISSPPRVPGSTLAGIPTFQPVGQGVPRVSSPPRVGTIGGQNLPVMPPLGGLMTKTNTALF